MKKTIVLLISLLFLLGCASMRSTKALQKVFVGSSLEEVIEVMGRPALIKGVVKNRYGKNVEVLEYNLTQEQIKEQLSADLLVASKLKETQNYWLYFVNDKLVKVSEATNWRKEIKRIYRLEF